jgi:hypothetical protein
MNYITRFALMIIVFITINSCKKKDNAISTSTNMTYLSLEDFHKKEGAPIQTFVIDAAAGGSYTSPQGTKVTIPPNTFFYYNSQPVVGEVTIKFRDVYKRSDMLLTGLSTSTGMDNDVMLVSGGMFYIKATQNGEALTKNFSPTITVEMPRTQDTIDMSPLVGIDTVINNENWMFWVSDPFVDSFQTATSYIYQLYNYDFGVLTDSGSWCNSDNSSYFDAYPQTPLHVNVEQSDTNDTEVYLFFTTVNSMVHVYQIWTPGFFPYDYAPLGFQCIIVAVQVKNEKLYASFQPFVIGSDTSVTLFPQQTTIAAFEAQLDALQ